MECEDEPVSGWTAAGRAKARATHNAKRDALTEAFADLLADGATPHEAAQKLGCGKSWAAMALRRLRDGLGWQAC